MATLTGARIIGRMNTLSRFLFWTLIGLAVMLGGCNMAQATPVPVVEATVPYVRVAQVVTATPITGGAGVASSTRDLHSIATNTPLPPPPTAQPTRSPYTCGTAPTGEHMQHEVVANIDYASKQITVAQRLTYYNEHDVALNDLVLDVHPNVWDDAFALDSLQLNSTDAYHNLDANRLTVFLPAPMNPGCAVTLDLRFTINVPRIALGFTAIKGYFGYGDRQLNLSLWLPTVVPRFNNRWLLHDTQTIGEQTVLELADWDVTLNVSNAADSLVVAAPGTQIQTDATQWRFIFESGRDFPVSMSENYRVLQQTTRQGTVVELYHFGDTVRFLDSGGTVDGAPHALQVAVESTEQFASLFGTLPYERVLVVQGDFPDGMEFSGLVYVSTNWFYGFEGGVQNYLTVITVHEIAHQWWYARVGNDAAFAPWLDEALATYSEYIYLEEFHPAQKNWWWSFRVAWYNPQGSVDSSVYEFENGRDYINAVYLRGVQMLHNLREDVGTQAFFDLLAAYAQAGDGQIATPELFWSLFTPEQLEATRGTRTGFLANPTIVNQPDE